MTRKISDKRPTNIKVIQPVVLVRKKSAKASRAYQSDLSVFNETLKSVNSNLSYLSNQVENVRIDLYGRITKLDEKFDSKLTTLTTQMNEKHEKLNLEISNIRVINGRVEPIVMELKKTVMEDGGLKDKVQIIEQEKLISKTWLTIMFSVISIVVSRVTFYFEKIVGVFK